jgi:hypothetical protein
MLNQILKNMNMRILEFKKTNHFLFIQWDRVIEDHLLYKVLPLVKCNRNQKDIIVVNPSFLKTRGVAKNNRASLILIIKEKLLITGYWCSDPIYLSKKETTANFQYLN